MILDLIMIAVVTAYYGFGFGYFLWVMFGAHRVGLKTEDLFDLEFYLVIILFLAAWPWVMHERGRRA